MTDQLVKAEYDEDTGISTVTLNTKWGTFTRTVKCQKEDADVQNRWTGILMAHYLCLADKAKAKSRAFHERAVGIEHAANVLVHVARDSQRWTIHSDSLLQLRCTAEEMAEISAKYRKIAEDMYKKYPEVIKNDLKMRRYVRDRKKTED